MYVHSLHRVSWSHKLLTRDTVLDANEHAFTLRFSTPRAFTSTYILYVPQQHTGRMWPRFFRDLWILPCETPLTRREKRYYSHKLRMRGQRTTERCFHLEQGTTTIVHQEGFHFLSMYWDTFPQRDSEKKNHPFLEPTPLMCSYIRYQRLLFTTRISVHSEWVVASPLSSIKPREHRLVGFFTLV